MNVGFVSGWDGQIIYGIDKAGIKIYNPMLSRKQDNWRSECGTVNLSDPRGNIIYPIKTLQVDVDRNYFNIPQNHR
jgi:hypothetical protein